MPDALLGGRDDCHAVMIHHPGNKSSYDCCLVAILLPRKQLHFWMIFLELLLFMERQLLRLSFKLVTKPTSIRSSSETKSILVHYCSLAAKKLFTMASSFCIASCLCSDAHNLATIECSATCARVFVFVAVFAFGAHHKNKSFGYV
ncbi:hypothetical protein Peur_009917 [Populus x canadensis]